MSFHDYPGDHYFIKVGQTLAQFNLRPSIPAPEAMTGQFTKNFFISKCLYLQDSCFPIKTSKFQPSKMYKKTYSALESF